MSRTGTRTGTEAWADLSDPHELEIAVTPFIVSSIEAQIALGCRRDHVIVIGRGQNAAFLKRLNDEHRSSDRFMRLIILGSFSNIVANNSTASSGTTRKFFHQCSAH